MDIYGTVRDFFEMIESYIDLLERYLKEANLKELLQYLFICIPEEIRAIIIVFLLIMLILGLKKIFKGG